MNIEKIAVDKGYVWVDKDAEIKEGDWVCGGLGGNDIKKYGKYFADDWYKIITSSISLEGVPSYIEWLSEQFLIDVGFKVHKDLERDGWLKIGFIKGYQVAEKELFTEDDVRKAIVMSATSPTDNLIDRCDEIIKHIKQSKK